MFADAASVQGSTLVTPAVPAGVAPESGANQAGIVGAPLPDPVVVRVVDGEGNPVSGARVTFAPSDGGSVSAGALSTDEQGRAQVDWTLGSRVGAQQLLTTVENGAAGSSGAMMAMSSVAPVPISATATAGPAASLVLSPAELTLDPGGTGSFTLQAFDAYGNQTSTAGASWTSADPAVATVSAGWGVSPPTIRGSHGPSRARRARAATTSSSSV